MGTTLTGTTPQDTYDSLIKVTDNGPLSGTLKALSDGLGNDSTLSLSTTAASIAGTLAVTGNATLTSNGISLRLGSATMNAGANLLIAGASSYKNWSIGVQQNIAGCLEFTPTATNGATTLGTTPAMVILDGGNVGIGTTAPTEKLHIVGSSDVAVRLQRTGVRELNLSSAGITATSEFLYLASDYGALSAIPFTVNSVERVRVTTNGLTFNGDTAAANALDDYEEGTWTMGISFGGASVGVTTANNTGTYTKIGRKVTVNGYLNLSSKGSSTGVAKITGLPFTIPNSATNYSAASLFFINISFTNQFQGFGEISTTGFVLEQITLLGATTALLDTNFANNSGIILSFTYFV